MADDQKPKRHRRTDSTKWEEQASEYLTNWQRTQAELENVRKRSVSEREQYTKFATRELILDLLPVLDNFERALAHVPADQADSGWLTGITYIHKQLVEALESHGVTPGTVKPGDPFDEATMHATSREPHADHPENTVIAVVGQAYSMNNEIIRPASVIVSAGSEN